jgi:ribosomal protein L37AE/L43A
MYKKVCSRCGRSSYSSSESGKWSCPVCREDLSNQIFLKGLAFDEIDHQAYLLQKKREDGRKLLRKKAIEISIQTIQKKIQ